MAEIEILDKDGTVINEIIMSKDEAEELTKGIQSTSAALYVLLKRAHDEKAWVAMGYDSWTSYIEGEFEFSRARSYQLINQANVIEEIHSASGVPLYITEREARSIKKKLPEITEKMKKDIKEADLEEEEAERRARKIIDESESVDNSQNQEGFDSYDEKEEEASNTLKEWEPDNVDESKFESPFSENDKFFYTHLKDTFSIFESIPEASELGSRLKKSEQERKELLKHAEFAFSWITQFIDEIE